MKKVLFAIILFSGITVSLYAQDDEVCGMDADDAWGGDTAAMHKFLASCGRIDTVKLDEHNKPVKTKPHHQTIKMVLNSGKVLHSDSIFFLVEIMPQFPGGDNGLYQYLKKNVVYPALAKVQKIQGRVYIEFIVERDGSVSHVKIIRGIGGGCNEEAARVVAQMPKWTSGKMKDNPVRVQYTLPVKFTL
jgi:TonB family protein